MKKFKVADLRPGMVFDQPVYIDPTNVLVQARQEISSKDIDRLVKWGIREVETSGSVVEQGQDVAATPAPTAPAAAQAGPPIGSSMPEDRRIQITSEYEAMRKSKIPFRTMVKETAELLKTNFQSLLDNKPFDNHAILNAAGTMVDEITQKKYLLLALHGLQLNVNWSVFHALHASCYAALLGNSLGYSRPKLQELVFATLLMDVGMARVPLHIREKASALNETEWAHIKKHPLVGYQLLTKNAKVKATLANVTLQHQEAFNGGGYPQGLRGGQIDEAPRIASIADRYTAMIEARPYREPLLPYDAMKHMLSVDMATFDPKLLRNFLGLLSIYPLGSLVELSNKKIGLVIGCNAQKPLRPLLRLLRDENGLPYNGFVFSDLMVDADIYIIKALEAKAAGLDLESEI